MAADGAPGTPPRPIVYTLGTSNRTWDEFLGLLRHHEIAAVADVRRSPGSRFEHFRHEKLAPPLEAAGTAYHRLGAALGGYRRGGYEAYAQTEEFARGLVELEALAREAVTGVMCAERLPWRCHRRFIGAELARRGWEVIHLIDIGRIWTPESQETQPPLL